jgi:hypothetical protein
MKLASGGVLSRCAKCFGSGEQKNENYFPTLRSCSVYIANSFASEIF